MNNTCQKRRIILKGTLAAGAVGSAIGTGVAYTHLAAKPTWPKDAFNASTIEEALLKLTGSNKIFPDPDNIQIKAPAIAENGMAHITIQSHLADTESITVFIPNNTSPLIANFKLDKKVINTITTRIKIESTGDIVAIISANNKLYSATKKIRTMANK